MIDQNQFEVFGYRTYICIVRVLGIKDEIINSAPGFFLLSKCQPGRLMALGDSRRVAGSNQRETGPSISLRPLLRPEAYVQ